MGSNQKRSPSIMPSPREAQELMSLLNGEESPSISNKSLNEIPLFEFTEADYIAIQCELNSSFDQLLRDRWIAALKAGSMNYSTEPESLPTKLISPNKYRFVAKLLEGRGPGKRRTPETMLNLIVPFQPDKFNFTKVNPKEILFRIKCYNEEMKTYLEATVLVNKSPIEYCSSLLVPYLERCLPQVIIQYSLKFSLTCLHN